MKNPMKTMGKVTIKLYPWISSYDRKTTGLLQVIALVGGFTNVMTKIFSFFGMYFSGKFVNQSIVSSFYLNKKNKKFFKNSQETEVTQIKHVKPKFTTT